MAEELTARSAKQAQCESRFQRAHQQVSKELTVNIQNAETPPIDAVWPGMGVEVHERHKKKDSIGRINFRSPYRSVPSFVRTGARS
jgi:hypothetical protein